MSVLILCVMFFPERELRGDVRAGQSSGIGSWVRRRQVTIQLGPVGGIGLHPSTARCISDSDERYDWVGGRCERVQRRDVGTLGKSRKASWRR